MVSSTPILASAHWESLLFSLGSCNVCGWHCSYANRMTEKISAMKIQSPHYHYPFSFSYSHVCLQEVMCSICWYSCKDDRYILEMNFPAIALGGVLAGSLVFLMQIWQQPLPSSSTVDFYYGEGLANRTCSHHFPCFSHRHLWSTAGDLFNVVWKIKIMCVYMSRSKGKSYYQKMHNNISV